MIDFRPLDSFVRRLRLDAMTHWSATPHRLRWWPLLPVLMCAAGVLAMIFAEGRLSQALAMVPIAFAPGVSGMVRIWGPIRQNRFEEPLDEREHMLKLRANAAGTAIVAYMAIGLAFWMVVAQVLPLAVPHTPQQWLAVAFTWQALLLSLPVLIASWSLSGPLDADD